MLGGFAFLTGLFCVGAAATGSAKQQFNVRMQQYQIEKVREELGSKYNPRVENVLLHQMRMRRTMEPIPLNPAPTYYIPPKSDHDLMWLHICMNQLGYESFEWAKDRIGRTFASDSIGSYFIRPSREWTRGISKVNQKIHIFGLSSKIVEGIWDSLLGWDEYGRRPKVYLGEGDKRTEWHFYGDLDEVVTKEDVGSREEWKFPEDLLGEKKKDALLEMISRVSTNSEPLLESIQFHDMDVYKKEMLDGYIVFNKGCPSWVSDDIYEKTRWRPGVKGYLVPAGWALE